MHTVCSWRHDIGCHGQIDISLRRWSLFFHSVGLLPMGTEKAKTIVQHTGPVAGDDQLHISMDCFVQWLQHAMILAVESLQH